MRKLRIALTKGRLEKAAVALFEALGMDTAELDHKGRRLILPVADFEVVLAKSADVITYVEHGVCDIGIVGKDTVMETGGVFYEMLDLGIGKCFFALAAIKGHDFYRGYAARRIATKYPRVARRFFDEKGMDVDIIRIEGSVELAPLLGLSDGIVDIVESGNTLRENGLEVVEKIVDISAQVIVNMASLKLRKEEISGLVRGLEAVAQTERKEADAG